MIPDKSSLDVVDSHIQQEWAMSTDYILCWMIWIFLCYVSTVCRFQSIMGEFSLDKVDLQLCVFTASRFQSILGQFSPNEVDLQPCVSTVCKFLPWRRSSTSGSRSLTILTPWTRPLSPQTSVELPTSIARVLSKTQDLQISSTNAVLHIDLISFCNYLYRYWHQSFSTETHFGAVHCIWSSVFIIIYW